MTSLSLTSEFCTTADEAKGGIDKTSRTQSLIVYRAVLMIRTKICMDIHYFQQAQWNFH